TLPSGETKSKNEPKSKLWLEHLKHRKYQQVVFDPSKLVITPQLSGGDYNMWPGFPVAPQKGSCIQFLRYVKNIVCKGNKDQYRWLMAWTAHIFQKPWEKPETAVAIQSEEEGTGKSFFPVVLSGIMHESSYFPASNSKMITGDFNGHLEYTILLHGEEAFSAESNRDDSIIKNLISDMMIPINAKGVQAKLAKNYARLMFTGNPPHIVKAGRFARRFLVLKISTQRLQDTSFYGNLLKYMKNGGYAALMYYLMHYPIDKFNLRIAIKTAGLLEQKLESQTIDERFWYTQLYEGHLSYIGTSQGKYYGNNQLEYHVIKYKLFSQFQRFAGRRVEKSKSDSVSFGMRFAKFFPVIDGHGKLLRDRNDAPLKFLKTDKHQEVPCYIVPPLSVCRAMFDNYLGQKCDWPDDNNEWVEKQYENG
ncbi:MAG TPA: primase-helicase family protein, partial [Bacteroidia bacterium]|nr:primase-helicase family protein [Bacteroidia bacterium]